MQNVMQNWSVFYGAKENKTFMSAQMPNTPIHTLFFTYLIYLS